jgi:glycosyltransferase involved in cell wall biosynthesis
MWRRYRTERTRQQQLAGYRALLVASRHMLNEYSCHGVSSDRLHLAPLFPPDSGPDEAPPVERPSSGRILFVGRLTDLKGGRFLVPALARAAQQLDIGLTLDVAGDGADRPNLEQLARRVGVPVAFHGWVTPARREQLMRQSDLLAVPSVWPEPFGLVGLEAGCVGLPSVAFAVGGIPDWLIAGESGELAPGDPPTVDGLADAVVRALADVQHLSRLRRGAWEMSRRFTLKAHLDILEPVLARAAEEKP